MGWADWFKPRVEQIDNNMEKKIQPSWSDNLAVSILKKDADKHRDEIIKLRLEIKRNPNLDSYDKEILKSKAEKNLKILKDIIEQIGEFEQYGCDIDGYTQEFTDEQVIIMARNLVS